MLTVLDGVRWEGAPVVGERSQTVLAALVLHGRGGVTDDWLIEQLWGDTPPTNPSKALQVVVSRARQATAAAAIARTQRGYRLGLAENDVDLWRLARLTELAKTSLDDEPACAVVPAREAVDLATGQGSPTNGEVKDAADGCLARARTVLGIALSRTGDHGEALGLLETAVRQHPGDEDLLASLLRSEAAVRGTGAALHRYENYRADLADRLGTDPGTTLRRLHRELLAADRPVRTGVRYESNPLLGRDDDVRALRAMAGSARVTSIVGAGGLGKTRLAHVLARAADQPIVHFIGLAGVSAAEDVVGEVGSALGVRDSLSGRRALTPQQRVDLRSRIAQQLDRAPTMLVLDNCEHVIGEVAELVAFLVASTRDLHVVTTSRAPLTIAAERVYALGQLGTADSAELFRQRALAARPDASLAQEEVAAIVSRLDGLPLAIELAAAKVRVMAVTDIGKRLADRFALLRGGDRNAPDRHQTLLAVIDWSWNLLADPERRALQRLAVFQDGFTLDTAEFIVGPGALDALHSLVQQSLLAVRDTAAGARYGMLETVREFGLMRLRDADAESDALAAQRDWACAYAEEQADRLDGPDQVAALDALQLEETNLSDVLRQALSSRAAETVVVLLGAIGRFWTMRGEHLRVGTLLNLIENTFDGWTPPAELTDRTRAALAIVLMNTAFAIDVHPAASWHLLRALGPGSTRPQLAAIVRVTLALHPDGLATDPTRLEQLCADPEPRTACFALQLRSHQLENDGDPAAAIEAASKALALADEGEGPWHRAMLLTQLAQLQAQLGQLDVAAANAELALPVLERIDAGDDAIQLRGLLMSSALAQGRLEVAGQRIHELTAAAQRQHDFGGRVVLATAEAEFALASGQHAEGLRAYRRAIEKMRTLRLPGLGEPTGYEPWTLYGESATLAACAWHGEGDDGADLFHLLSQKLPILLDPAINKRFDLPVVGMVMYGLSAWGLTATALPVSGAVRLGVLADRLGYNRSVPTMAMSTLTDLAERMQPGLLDTIAAEYGDRRGPQLLSEARRVVTDLFGPTDVPRPPHRT